MANNENLIPIPGRLHSVATEGHVSGADEIYDDTQQKDQATINSEVQEALGTGGSVDEKIASAVNTEKTRAEGAEGALDGRVDTLEDAVGTGGSVDSRISAAVATETTRAQAAEADRYTKSETYNKTELNNMITTPNQEYVSVIATAQTTAVTDVLPATGAADTTYRVGNWDGTQYNDSVFSEYAWNGSAYIKLSTKSQVGEVYDISVNHADTKYADLAAALGTNGANIPQSLRKGGMSVKFVQSSDNKYVQYRCIADDFTTDTTQWAITEEGVYVENPEFVYVKTDKEGKILWAIKANGSIYWGAGVPQQVIDYVNEKISELSLDEYEDIVTFLGNLIEGDTLAELLNGKVDKEEGKGIVVTQYVQDVENPEWIRVEADSEGKILGGRKKDGTVVENVGIEANNATIHTADIHTLEAEELQFNSSVGSELTVDTFEVNEEIVLSEEAKDKLQNEVLEGAVLNTDNSFLRGNSFIDIYNPYSDMGNTVKLRGQMHMHTTNSDGWFSPTYQAERYRNAGFDFYVITDHDTYLANPEKLPITPNPNVSGIIWLGSSFEESIPNSEQHINVYLTDHLMPGKTYKGEHITANAVLTEYAVNGNSFCCLNHPNWNFRLSNGINQYQTNYKITQLINALNFCEVWNGGLTSETRDPEQTGTQENNWANCARCWDILLTMGRKVFGLATDDCHQNNDFLRGYVEVYAKSNTAEAIWDALVKGQFVSYNGNGALNPINVTSVKVENGYINVKTNIACDIYFFGSCEYTASEEHPENDTYSPNELQISTSTTSASYKILGNEGYVRCAIKNGYNYVWLQPIIIRTSEIKKSYLL